MKKMYAGARLRRLREERNLSQSALAKALELSPSYVNQLENDQRPLTVPVLLKLNAEFDLDVQFFASDSDARLVADVHHALAETSESGDVSLAEVDELVARMPAVGRTLVMLHRRLHAATEQLDQFSTQLSGEPASDVSLVPMPYEEVRDFFYDRKNHIAVLDDAAEQMFLDNGLSVGAVDLQLARLLRDQHGVTVTIRTDEPDKLGPKRYYDPNKSVLTLARRLSAGQRAFQIAMQLAFFTQADVIDSLVAEDESLSAESAALARVGLAHYFAGALLLPYTQFLQSAEALRYDIDLLSLKFEVGFETVCHRLSTLQRHGQRGIPFFFVRTDRAGNISKRQSATAFHFSRVGGSCPLWVIHEAFASPGRILTQVAKMPDGRTYLWVARTTHSGGLGYLAPERNFAVGLGCDIGYADRMVYSHGIQTDDPATIVPIGAGCKVCDRPACSQRAFPQLGRSISVSENSSSHLPYPQQWGANSRAHRLHLQFPGATTLFCFHGRHATRCRDPSSTGSSPPFGRGRCGRHRDWFGCLDRNSVGRRSQHRDRSRVSGALVDDCSADRCRRLGYRASVDRVRRLDPRPWVVRMVCEPAVHRRNWGVDVCERSIDSNHAGQLDGRCSGSGVACGDGPRTRGRRGDGPGVDVPGSRRAQSRRA